MFAGVEVAMAVAGGVGVGVFVGASVAVSGARVCVDVVAVAGGAAVVGALVGAGVAVAEAGVLVKTGTVADQVATGVDMPVVAVKDACALGVAPRWAVGEGAADAAPSPPLQPAATATSTKAKAATAPSFLLISIQACPWPYSTGRRAVAKSRPMCIELARVALAAPDPNE